MHFEVDIFFESDFLLLYFLSGDSSRDLFIPGRWRLPTAFQKGSPFSPSPKKKGHVHRLARLICFGLSIFSGNREVETNTTHPEAEAKLIGNPPATL